MIKHLSRIFFKLSQKIKQTNKNVSFEKNTKGLILKFGNLKGHHSFSNYEENFFLNFNIK